MLASIKLIRSFWSDESGVTAVEYGMIAALVAGAIVVIVTTLGGSLSTAFSTINTAITPKS